MNEFVGRVLMALTVSVEPLLHCRHIILFLARSISQFLRKGATSFPSAGYVCINRSIRMEEKWKALEEKLNDEKWPQIYMFKFIVPADNKRVAQVEELFNTQEAEVSMRTSKKGNFVSITAKEMMLSATGVIERYKDAAKIEGVISL